jgi:hypothetical protein
MAETFERPAARRRPRAAADETSDPMDTNTAPPASPPVPTPGPSAPEPAAMPEPPPTVSSTATPARIAEQPTPPPTPVAPRPTSGAYVTLNVRVSIEIDQLISRAMAKTGMTKRAAVEQALLRTYG